ncbi:MAG TPA: PEGA domain-containing protein, partial [Archangium sp.]|nr:PEGA domain-containing protein [Archangium sp.]
EAPAPESPPEAQAVPASPGDTAPAAEAAAAATPEAGAAPEAGATPQAPAPTDALVAAPPEVNAGTAPGSSEAKNEAPETTQPAKRGKVTPSRRTAQRTTSNVETSPEQVTTADEADRAWQALERERTDAAEPSAEKGSLTLVTEPYAKVYLGSRALGETPLFRVPFEPGKYTLRLVAPYFKPLKLQVEIKAGEVTSIRAPLEKLSRE